MSFKALKALPITDFKVAVMGNSQTIAVGDAIISGGTGHNKAALTAASTSGPLLGVVVAIVGDKGNVLELDSVTTGSGNETTPVHYVQYIPSYIPVEYVVDMSAAVGVTTTGSDGMCWFNLSSSAGKLDETSVAFIAGTQGQFWSFGPDKTDNTNKTVIGIISKHI